LGTSTLLLILGIVMGELLQAQLAAPDTNVVGSRYGELLSLHATATAVLYLGPFWLGLATYILPLQIGTARLALPRLHAFATWLYVVGGVVFLAIYLDQRYGGTFFSPSNKAGVAVWQHTIWLFGRPEAFVLLLPGLGAAGDIVSTHFRRPLVDLTTARAALIAFAGLSFAVWAAGPGRASAAVVLPTSTWLTALTAGPVAVSVLLWLATGRSGPPRFHISLAFVAGAVLLLALGA